MDDEAIRGHPLWPQLSSPYTWRIEDRCEGIFFIASAAAGEAINWNCPITVPASPAQDAAIP